MEVLASIGRMPVGYFMPNRAKIRKDYEKILQPCSHARTALLVWLQYELESPDLPEKVQTTLSMMRRKNQNDMMAAT